MSVSSSLPVPYSAPVASEPPKDISHQQSIKTAENEIKDAHRKLPVSNDYQDPWCITPEQRQYYMKQFMSMQPDVDGKIDGMLLKYF